MIEIEKHANEIRAHVEARRDLQAYSVWCDFGQSNGGAGVVALSAHVFDDGVTVLKLVIGAVKRLDNDGIMDMAMKEEK